MSKVFGTFVGKLSPHLVCLSCRQSAALIAVTNVAEYLDETAIRRMVLPKTKLVYEKNTGDLKIILNVLACVEKTLDRLDKAQIIDEVLPLLWNVRLQDPEITLRVVSKCLQGSEESACFCAWLVSYLTLMEHKETSFRLLNKYTYIFQSAPYGSEGLFCHFNSLLIFSRSETVFLNKFIYLT